jgi:SAM-dependent methyltransferase
MTRLFERSRLERETIQQALVDAAPFFRGRVLDLGCGDQPYAPLVRRQGAMYVGIDIATTQRPAPDVCADSLSLPFKSSSFDAILSTQVIEHVRDPFRLFAEIRRVLRPGGHLVMTAPQLWPLHEEPHDYFRFTRYGLDMLAARNGLQVLVLRERGNGILALGQMTEVLLYGAIGERSALRVPLKILLAPYLSVCSALDRWLPYPKLTLGYLLVAQKPSLSK